ncbi:hypothetical protein D9615_002449 [Tricholomella constricta]|uniref:Tyr recombinase domain-containing protein n=1 Tax=Tricholomella constricta TaxID=117010 RepID=A0A8H5HN71_9AGAR|nr:hypothetical protein D9615_002449 [Tricholomella constricta]
MASSLQDTSNKRPRRSVKKKSDGAKKSLDTLTKTGSAKVKEYICVQKTEDNYERYVNQGKEFLSELVEGRKADGIEVCEDGIPTDELEKALDLSAPNKYSATVVAAFITQKCFTEDLSDSYAQGIHAAFCRYWDTMSGTTYAGPYRIDKTTGKITGCPARAPLVTDLVKAVKTKGKKKGADATRHHAEAMPIEDLQKLMRFSEDACPHDQLEATANNDILGCSKEIVEHGFLRGFASTAFTLWTRCFELLTLNVRDITWNCQGPAPYYTPHFEVHLENRKGWQKQAGFDGPRNSCRYKIYEQKDHQEMDMYTHLPQWLKLYESQIRRPLEPDDFLFPYIAPNGTIHPKRDMSYTSFAKTLAQFTKAAGLEKTYTTHSFRRGGAQYRFMFAPRHLRWTLNRVRWWGGWAIGENVDTLINYLVDSLQRYENDHSDALNPTQSEANVSFAGNQMLQEATTASEMREFKAVMDRSLGITTGEVKANMQEIKCTLEDFMSRISFTAGWAGTHQRHSTHPYDAGHTFPPDTIYASLPHRSRPSVRLARIKETAPYPTQSPSVTSIGSQESNDVSFSANKGKAPTCRKKKTMPPIGEAIIPDIGGGEGAWKRAALQWTDGDPFRGLHIPLKDWPTSWYTGEMKLFTASKRHQRELIGEEWIRLGRSDEAFEAAYPEDYQYLTTLLDAIRTKLRKKRRRSKNGSPTERNMSTSTSAED